MYKLERAKLKFELFVVDASRTNTYHRNANNRVLCFADAYQVGSDGSITFYQTTLIKDKAIKVPVLTYPSGRWEAVSLVDDNNVYPVFRGAGHFASPVSDTEANSFKEAAADSDTEASSNNLSPVRYVRTSTADAAQVNLNMPGVSNNPQDFKKAKNEWLEKNLKEYIKQADQFSMHQFMAYLQKEPLFRQFRPTDTDVEWTASSLIRERQVAARKFFQPNIQKKIGLILPDLMKRQWDGKMTPILEALNDREETKNASSIDLAVWMSQNGIS